MRLTQLPNLSYDKLSIYSTAESGQNLRNDTWKEGDGAWISKRNITWSLNVMPKLLNEI